MKIVFYYLKRMNIFNFIAEVKTMIDRMTADPAIVPAPNPPLADMQAALDTLSATAEAARFGDRNLISLRKEQQEIMMSMVRKQAAYVSNVCTPVQAEALNFKLAKEPSPAPPIDAPQDLKAKPTSVNNGVEITWRKTKHAYGYLIQKTQQNPLETAAEWEDVMFTNRSKVVVEGLQNLGKYWFRIVGYSAKGQSPYSDPVLSVVL